MTVDCCVCTAHSRLHDPGRPPGVRVAARQHVSGVRLGQRQRLHPRQVGHSSVQSPPATRPPREVTRVKTPLASVGGPSLCGWSIVSVQPLFPVDGRSSLCARSRSWLVPTLREPVLASPPCPLPLSAGGPSLTSSRLLLLAGSSIRRRWRATRSSTTSRSAPAAIAASANRSPTSRSAVRKPWPARQIWPATHFRVARMAVSTTTNLRKFPRLSNGIEPLR